MKKIFPMMEQKLLSFEKKGTIILDEILDKNECDKLLEKVEKTRNWSTNIFRSKEDFEKDSQMQKTNPGRGVQNLAEEYNLDFIEKNEYFIYCLNKLVGKDYEIILKKFVVGVPESWIPNWLKKIISKKLVANLGPYIKKEFRNITYFRGIDYHMDLIDHPGQLGDYVTVYVYLNDVDLNMSPLHLIESSHEFGATKFPHFIRNDQKDTIDYGIDEKNYKKYNKHILTGKKGTIYLWSSMTLHGTKPTEGDKQRISLRYTIKKNKENYNNNTLIDNILHNVAHKKRLNVMRDDIDLKSKNHNQVKFDKVLK
jgi:hypothetical protein